MAWQGTAGEARPGAARLGEAGQASIGTATHGTARQGAGGQAPPSLISSKCEACFAFADAFRGHLALIP